MPKDDLACGSDAELRAAIGVIDRLLGREELTPDEGDHLDVLTDQVERHEAEHEPAPRQTGVETLRMLIAESGRTQARLAAEIGVAASTLSEILAGKRRISNRVRDALAAWFRVDPSVFLDDPGAAR